LYTLSCGFGVARPAGFEPVEPGIIITAPRATSRDIKRHKASNYQPG
jgi:hypothetical protein